MKNKKALKANILFTLCLLAVAAVCAFFLARRPDAATAVLTYGDSGQTLNIDLAKRQQYDLESNGYTIHLVVENGAIRFVDSPCPDHVCEGYGWLSKDGDWAACLPAKASVLVLEEE